VIGNDIVDLALEGESNWKTWLFEQNIYNKGTTSDFKLLKIQISWYGVMEQEGSYTKSTIEQQDTGYFPLNLECAYEKTTLRR
jgi:hypothetical protein